jgi:diaminohydroxyphosphoribosylaminopyrimidine deaminase / 5-amino-6-(5-phosphoribosylamino)uracil reductase
MAVNATTEWTTPAVAADEAHMRRALDLARRGLGLASPNPMVGAVLVANGALVGEGWHEGPGTPHAEVGALARAQGRARGATLYVNLEPCAHHGRSGPCAPAVVEAGVARVVASMRDPFGEVDGRGFAYLREHGVDVSCGVLEPEARRLNEGFISYISTGRPFVTLKMAASLDGRTAAGDGSSRWITGEEARRDVHRLRAGSDAVVVGAGTALVDRPSLTVRLDDYRGRQPLRVVVDGSGRTPAEGPTFDGSAPTLLATSRRAAASSVAAWRTAGAQVMVGGDEEVSLPYLVEFLGRERDVRNVLIEGGPTLAWAAVEAGVVDRMVLYLAPIVLGGRESPGIFGGRGVDSIAGAIPMRIRSVERIGADLRVEADVYRDH